MESGSGRGRGRGRGVAGNDLSERSDLRRPHVSPELPVVPTGTPAPAPQQDNSQDTPSGTGTGKDIVKNYSILLTTNGTVTQFGLESST